jgi:uncharacterized membrane protein
MKRWLKPGLTTLALATGMHFAVIWAAPRLILRQVIAGVSRRVGINAALHARRPTAASRDVVLPSPDLLYTICAFDLSTRPIKLTAAVPENTYWSLSLYADNTDNFFVVNDRKVAGKTVTVDLVGPNSVQASAEPISMVATTADTSRAAFLVRSPSKRGIALFRILVDREERLGALQEVQKQAACMSL